MKALYKLNMRRQAVLLACFAAILAMYFSVIVYMYDPAMFAVLDSITKLMPQLMAMFGMGAPAGGFSGINHMLATYMYGMLMMIMPMIYTIIEANRLVARYVDGGGMAYLLAAPHSRKSVARTQALALVTGEALLMAFSFGVGVLCCALLAPGALDIPSFAVMNAGALLLHLAISGFCFFISCCCDESKTALSITSGVLIFMYVCQMMKNLGDKLSVCQYFTVFTLFDANALLAGQIKAYLFMGALALLTALFYALGVRRFCRRDLHI